MTAPHIPDDLRHWVLGCARSHVASDDIVRLMQRQGWSEERAAEAVAWVLADQRFEVPRLCHEGHRVRVGRKAVDIVTRSDDGSLVLLGGLLSPKECQGLMAEAEARLDIAKTTTRAADHVHAGRIAMSHFFPLGCSPLVRRIEQRVEALFGWPIADTEGIQIQRYGPGGRYEPHFDYFDGVAPPLRGDGPPRQRVATLLCYLAMPEQGGATHFVQHMLSFTPRPGDAVFFSYDRPSPSTGTLHAGQPVEQGHKWVVNVWFRERLIDG